MAINLKPTFEHILVEYVGEVTDDIVSTTPPGNYSVKGRLHKCKVKTIGEAVPLGSTPVLAVDNVVIIEKGLPDEYKEAGKLFTIHWKDLKLIYTET